MRPPPVTDRGFIYIKSKQHSFKRFENGYKLLKYALFRKSCTFIYIYIIRLDSYR